MSSVSESTTKILKFLNPFNTQHLICSYSHRACSTALECQLT